MQQTITPSRAAVSEANSLHEGIWPASAARAGGRLAIGALTLEEIAAEHGTPFMLIDEDVARSRATLVKAALDAAFGGADVYYAGKALLTADIARLVVAAGLRLDVCSLGELELALRAGISPELIGFHGNAKSVRAIERGVNAGVGTFVLDSEAEIGRIAAAARAAGRVQRVRLRVAVGVHAETHEFLATSHEDQKFGVPYGQGAALAARIREHESLELVGLHTHIGSQIFDHEGFAEAARRMLGLHAEIGGLTECNLGGGFGIAYTEADSPGEIEKIAASLAATVKAECARLGLQQPRMAFEPGRWIIGPAGITCYLVNTVKAVELETGTRTYVSVDGGMSDNARTALYGAQYSARLANRESAAEPVLVRIAGHHCESGDIVVDQEYLPGDVAPGDLVAVAATGAYCHSLASNYNLTPRPPVLAISSGRVRVMIERESIDEVLARDAGLAPAKSETERSK